MRTIHTLSPDVISKIAAGEVIERPAYVLKELLENAIDASAKNIIIDVEDAGFRLITVRDDGVGMSRDDVEICFLPHTTSKLVSIDNLVQIRSLGFRGEALSAIAHVSNLTIITRRQDDVGGTKVSIRNGKIDEVSQYGSPIGTTVCVSHLFSSVPARKKFMKSSKTEMRLNTEMILRFVLSHPEIHFRLTHNGKNIFDFPSRKDSDDRLTEVIGDVSQSLLLLSKQENYLTIHGFIGSPNVASRNVKQYLFVNKRYVTDQIVRLAVKEAYGSLISSSFHPVFVLSISLPPEMVDVNVHPQKETVSFLDQKLLFSEIKQAVSETLSKHNLTFRMAKFRLEHSALTGETYSDSATYLRNGGILKNEKTLGLVKKESQFFQLFTTYIGYESDSNFVLIDQHGAHERILYEKLVQSFTQKKKQTDSFILQKPISLSLSLSDLQLLEEHDDVFKKMGFSIEKLSSAGIIIREVPEIFRGRNISKILDDMFSELKLEIDASSVDFRSNTMLKFLACRSAVKAGDILTASQMKKLVKTLEETRENTTCPHGRPTKFVIKKDEIGNWFGR